MSGILINEIFYSIQGESTFAGLPCVLVRTTGCQMRCRWCDTTYSFYQGKWMTLEEVLDEVRRFGCPLVELTGGEPLLQPAAHTLMERLCDAGYEVLVETGGGLDIAPVDPRVRRIVDVKCPASGEAEHNHWPNLDRLRADRSAQVRDRRARRLRVGARAGADAGARGALPGPVLAGARRARSSSRWRRGCSRTACRCGSRSSSTS